MINPYNPDDILPYYPACLDIETRSDGSVIAIGFAYQSDQRHYNVYPDWQMWLADMKILLQGDYRNQIKRVYAHYGGKFDWTSLAESSMLGDAMGEFEKVLLSGGRIIGGTYQIPGARVKLRLMDSYSLLVSGLDKITSMFNVEHKKLYLGDNRLPEQVYHENPDLFYQYLKNDVLGLQETLFEFWSYIYREEGSIGDLPMTLASLSLKLWRKRLDNSILVTWNKKVVEFERRAYTGGRVELFQPGIHDVTSHDINSLYPSVMAANNFPASYHGAWTHEYEGFGIYEVDYIQSNRTLPPLLRDENTHEFQYSGHGVYTSIELEKLAEIGGFYVVQQGWVYESYAALFKSYVESWYSRRLQHKADNNSGLEYICKILLNSLYGKFGQHPESHSLKLGTKENEDKLLENEQEYIDYGTYLVVKENTRSEHIFCGIAAFVTAYARLSLYEYMRQVIQSGHKLIYCDTDSVHHSGAEIETGRELGQMKLEYTGTGTYIARKLYQIVTDDKRKVVAKGIGKDAHIKLTELDFYMLSSGGKAKIPFTTFHTPKEVMLHSLKSCEPIERTRTVSLTDKRSEFVYNQI